MTSGKVPFWFSALGQSFKKITKNNVFVQLLYFLYQHTDKVFIYPLISNCNIDLVDFIEFEGHEECLFFCIKMADLVRNDRNGRSNWRDAELQHVVDY